jgi:hypothetical protein
MKVLILETCTYEIEVKPGNTPQQTAAIARAAYLADHDKATLVSVDERGFRVGEDPNPEQNWFDEDELGDVALPEPCIHEKLVKGPAGLYVCGDCGETPDFFKDGKDGTLSLAEAYPGLAEDLAPKAEVNPSGDGAMPMPTAEELAAGPPAGAGEVGDKAFQPLPPSHTITHVGSK